MNNFCYAKQNYRAKYEKPSLIAQTNQNNTYSLNVNNNNEIYIRTPAELKLHFDTSDIMSIDVCALLITYMLNTN